MSLPALYHYTCADHGAPGIDRTGYVLALMDWSRLDRALARVGRPTTGLADAPSVAWLTPLDAPNIWHLGLTRISLDCDRTAVRYTVDAPDALPWAEFCRIYRPRPKWRASLERDRLPGVWWVATDPCEVIARHDMAAVPA